jgi:hypothetical protein
MAVRVRARVRFALRLSSPIIADYRQIRSDFITPPRHGHKAWTLRETRRKKQDSNHTWKIYCNPLKHVFTKGDIFERFHYAREIIKETRRQYKKIAVFKADMFKAFNSINWDFMFKCFEAREFTSKWVVMIKYLVLQGYSQMVLKSVVGQIRYFFHYPNKYKLQITSAWDEDFFF